MKKFTKQKYMKNWIKKIILKWYDGELIEKPEVRDIIDWNGIVLKQAKPEEKVTLKYDSFKYVVKLIQTTK